MDYSSCDYQLDYTAEQTMDIVQCFLAEEAGYQQNVNFQDTQYSGPCPTFTDTPFLCPGTPASAPPVVNKDTGSDVKPRKHTCGICFQKFPSRKEFSRHARTHRAEKQLHKCDFCGKHFVQKTTMETHRRIHTGEKPFQCQICQRQFSDQSSYIKHERVHSGERPYTCTLCDKSFNQSGNLSRHMKTVHRSEH